MKAKIVDSIQEVTQEPGFKSSMAKLRRMAAPWGRRSFTSENFDQAGKLMKMPE